MADKKRIVENKPMPKTEKELDTSASPKLKAQTASQKEKEAAKAKAKAQKEKEAAKAKAKAQKEKEAAKAKAKAQKEKEAAKAKAKAQKEKEAAKAKAKAQKEKEAAKAKAKAQKEKEAAKAKAKAQKEKEAAKAKAKAQKEKEAAKAKAKAQKEKEAAKSENKSEIKDIEKSTSTTQTQAAKQPIESKITKETQAPVSKISVYKKEINDHTEASPKAENIEDAKKNKGSIIEKIKKISPDSPSNSQIKGKIEAYKQDITQEFQMRWEMHKNVQTLKQKELALAKKLEAERETREGIDHNRIKKKRRIVAFTAVIVLIILYLFVFAPNSEKQFSDVPVYYKNLEVGKDIEGEIKAIDITLKGPRLKLFFLDKNELYAVVDMKDVNAYGFFPAVVNISGIPEKVDIVTQTYAAYSAKVIEAQDSQYKIDIEYSHSLPDGYLVLENRMSADKAAVYGSDEDIAKIISVKGEIDTSKKRKDFTTQVVLHAYDENGNILKDVHMSPSVVTSDVFVGIKKEVNVNILTTGDVPKRYIFEGMTSEAQTITIAGEKNILRKLDYVNTVPVNLSGYTQTTDVTANIEFPDGVYPYEDNTSIQATINVTAMAIVTYEINEVEVVSVPDGLEIDTSNIPSVIMVTFGARPSDIQNFSKDDVRLFINMEGREEGSYRMPVLYNIPDPIYVINTNAETVPVKLYKAN